MTNQGCHNSERFHVFKSSIIIAINKDGPSCTVSTEERTDHNTSPFLPSSSPHHACPGWSDPFLRRCGQSALQADSTINVTLNVAVNKFQPNMVKTAVLRLFGIPNNNNNNTNNNNIIRQHGSHFSSSGWDSTESNVTLYYINLVTGLHLGRSLVCTLVMLLLNLLRKRPKACVCYWWL